MSSASADPPASNPQTTASAPAAPTRHVLLAREDRSFPHRRTILAWCGVPSPELQQLAQPRYPPQAWQPIFDAERGSGFRSTSSGVAAADFEALSLFPPSEGKTGQGCMSGCGNRGGPGWCVFVSLGGASGSPPEKFSCAPAASVLS